MNLILSYHLRIVRRLLAILLLTALLAGCVTASTDELEKQVPDKTDPTLASEENFTRETFREPPETEEEPLRLRLAVVGDLMVHGPQIRAQEQPDGSHDFHNNFDFVRPWLQEADLALGNLETTFAGPEKGYSSFPRFNTPDAFAEALKAAGFAAVSTANNHTVDTGADGFFRTLQVLKSHGLNPIGTRENLTSPFWTLMTHNGITIGVTAVTYETPPYQGRRTLNALLIPGELDGLISSFGYGTLEQDLSEVRNQLTEMREAGADFTAVMIHWGEEYQQRQNVWQERIANELAAAGADLILGAHPHVLQPVRPIQRDSEAPESWVAYSLGNFISNQRFEILKRREPEDGAILFVDLVKHSDQGVVEVESVSYQPTWVHRYWQTDRMVYEILPLVEALESPEAYNLNSEESLNRAKASLERTQSLWKNLPLTQKR